MNTKIKLIIKLKAINLSFKKKKGSCFICGKPRHQAPQCRKRMRNDKPTQPKENLVKAYDIIVTVISQANIMANVKD